MCRICGRVFKCVFDSMPSRAPVLPPTNRSLLLTPRRTAQLSSFSTLSTSLSRLSLRSSAPLSRPKLPSITFTSTTLPSMAQPPPRSFSTSASLGAKRNTYNPSRRVQKRRHGFLSRVKTRTGRSLLARRRLKGRKDLSY